MTLPIDINAVREQLAAADEQIEQLHRFRTWLREGLELAGETPAAAQHVLPPAATEEPAPPPPAKVRQAAPPKPRATGKGRDGLTDRQQQVLSAVNSLASATRKEIADHIGYDPTEHLKVLRHRGLIEATGNTRNRRFHSITREQAEAARPAGTEFGRTSPATQRQMDEGVLRVKVLDAIRRDQAALNVDRLAQGLILDRDRVAEAVKQLIADGKVLIADEDGCLTALTEQELRRRRATAA